MECPADVGILFFEMPPKSRGKKYMDDMPCKYTKQIG
jgi:hypothetical protein